MNYIRKTLSVIVAVTMAFCSNILCMAADSTAELEQVTVEAVELTEELIATDESYTYMPKTRGTIYVGEVFNRYDTLSASDAIDFFPFTLTSAKSVVFGFSSGNADYAANLALLDPDTGNVTLSNVWLYPGDTLWTSSLDKNNYCWVVLSLSNTYTTAQYRLSMNATNKSGATSIVSVSSDFSYASFLYSNGAILLNNENIQEKVKNFLPYIADGFQDKYESGSPSYLVATVGVATSENYIDGTIYYGSYTSTNPHINPYTHLGHSSQNAILIPIVGHTVGISISSNYIKYTYESFDAIGYLVYDLESGKIIDFMSPLNIFYSDFFNYTYSASLYAEINLSNNYF